MSWESSVNWIFLLFDPDNSNSKDPGNKLSLYWALSIDKTQKLLPVTILVLEPKMKSLFSSSNIKDLYWPYIDNDGELLGTIGLYRILPLPWSSA